MVDSIIFEIISDLDSKRAQKLNNERTDISHCEIKTFFIKFNEISETLQKNKINFSWSIMVKKIKEN